MSAHDLRRTLDRLAAERSCAVRSGLGGNAVYMSDLDAELQATHAAYVGAAVTEIASLRAALGGTLCG